MIRESKEFPPGLFYNRVKNPVTRISQPRHDKVVLIQTTIDGAGVDSDIGVFCSDLIDTFGRRNDTEHSNVFDAPIF